jgi:hypothetical protein
MTFIVDGYLLVSLEPSHQLQHYLFYYILPTTSPWGVTLELELERGRKL